MGKKFRGKDSIYTTNKYKYDLLQYEAIRSFGDSIYNGKTSIDKADIDQSSLLDDLKNFNDRDNHKQKKVKIEREILIQVHLLFKKVENFQAAHNVQMTSPNGPILVKTSRTIVGRK